MIDRLRRLLIKRGTLLCPVPSGDGGQTLTPAGSSRRRTRCHLPRLSPWAELPEVPDGTDDVALQRLECFSRRLAFLASARQVGTCLLRVLALGEDDAVEDPVQLPVTTAIQAVAHESGGGGLERCGAGVGGELGLAFEPSARAENGCQLAGRQQIDADELGHRAYQSALSSESIDGAEPIVVRLRDFNAPEQERDELWTQLVYAYPYVPIAGSVRISIAIFSYLGPAAAR